MLTDKQRIELLRGDRRKLTAVAPVLMRLASWVMVLWFGLLVFCLLKPGAEEGAIIVGVLGVPVFLIWLLTRALPSLVKFANEHWS